MMRRTSSLTLSVNGGGVGGGVLFLACVLGLAAPSWAVEVRLKVLEVPQPIATDPFDPAWSQAEAVNIPLMAQRIAPPGGGGAVTQVTVKAIQCKMEMFFLVAWKDRTQNDYPSTAEGFTDGVALQFPMQPGTMPSPFMGDRDRAVVIWRWSASAQKDLDEGYQSAKLHRPRVTADLYAFADDPTFRTGEGAGNIISQRRRVSPVENLEAKGFGTLTTTSDQPVKGKGVWKDGIWSVVFRRDLTGTPAFWRGSQLPFAVAVWDGEGRERNGIKSVSVWQTLVLPGAAEPSARTPEQEGRRVFERFGCGVCHGAQALGGIPNPNAQVDPIPALNKVKSAFTREEAMNVIMKGREPARKEASGAPPPFKMNDWEQVMTKEEVDRVIDYLFSLQPKEEW